MTREIKFRAWKKEESEMTLFDSFYEIQRWNRYPDELEDFVMMQYTGLKDRHGKEIYEGDITKNERGETGEVAFENGGFFSRYLPPYDWDPMETGDGLLEKSEVIGNIYENPGLLK